MLKTTKSVKTTTSKSIKTTTSKSRDKKYFLVSTEDTGNREDCSIFYCDLVLAVSESAAINFVARRDSCDPKSLCAHKVKLNVPTIAECKSLKSSEYVSEDDEGEEDDEDSE